MTQQHDPGLQPRAVLDGVGDRVGNSAKPHVTEPVVDLLACRHRVFSRLGTLGHNDDGGISTALVAAVQQLADVVDVEGFFRNQDGRCSTGDTRVGGDPSRVAAHHFHDHHPVMALRRGVQPVDGVGGDLHRGVEPERHLGGRQVVVDGLGHTDDGQVEVVEELEGDGQRTVAADHDERVDPHLTKRRRHLLRPARIVVWTTPACAQQRAALWQHPAQRPHVERHRPTFAYPIPRIEEPDQFVAVVQLALADDRPRLRSPLSAKIRARGPATPVLCKLPRENYAQTRH